MIIRRSNCLATVSLGKLVAAVSFCAVLISNPVVAQDIPAELEGKITGIKVGETGPDILEVMGIEVEVPGNTPIHTPVTTLTMDDLLGSFLPGREFPGFLGGTAIVEAVTSNGTTIAHDIFVEPEENVLIGTVTANDNGVLSILGVSVNLIVDWRLAGTPFNENGFQVDLTTVEIGSFAVAEGYLGIDGLFYAHTIEANGDIIGDKNQTSITRAQCREDHRLEIRGSSTTPTGVVSIYNNDTGNYIGTVLIEPEGDGSPFGRYRFLKRVGLRCPLNVRVENSNGSFAISEVENR